MIFWDQKVKRYRDESGRFISNKSVRRSVEQMVAQVEREVTRHANRLMSGRISIAQWQREMRKTLGAAHTVAGAVGRGGRSQMTAADWGRIGGRLRSEYRYINRFARIIETGKFQTGDQIATRAKAYASAVRVTYTKAEIQSAKEGAFTEAKRTLHASESCSACRAVSGRWIAIEEMPEIGSLTCRNWCRCSMEFRNTSVQ